MRDLTNQKFNRWLVLSFEYSKRPHHYWKCRCECGEERILQANAIIRGSSRSCGCLRVETSKHLHTTHGASDTGAYNAWLSMKARVRKKTGPIFKSYGARGIKYCERWEEFVNFYEDIGHLWTPGMTLERINNDRNYEPSNCKWIPKSEQSRNRRSIVWIETSMGTMSVQDACRAAGISRGAMEHRIVARWPVDRILEPARKTKNY